MDAPWRIQLLGALRAEMGGTTLTRFATSRVAALLARLALHPRRAHSREELCDLLWPEADQAAGRLNLRVALASLRRQIEPPPLPAGSVLTADRSFVGLNPAAFGCDVAEFEAACAKAFRAASPAAKRQALAQAAALYGGDLLPGFYDDWIVEERERLAALHEELCAQREDLASRMPAEAPPPPEDLVDAEPAAPAPRLVRLPLQFTRLFGREADCARIAALLESPSTRLVTLTGPGGVGKTRLAGEAARRVADHPRARPGPVCFVPLADLSDARLIPAAIADALGLDQAAGAGPLDQAADALAGLPPALLVLDNFEHLVERGAPLVLSLLTRVPSLACLVTSRRRLSLPGEREYPVPPIPVPPPDARETPEGIAQAAAVQMFVDRAQAARPDFQLTRGNAAEVAALCRTLEGLPLALELVAARALALSPAQMNERLARRFDQKNEVLTRRRGGKAGRHGSLWAALAWSYDLIPPPLQRFFAGLSVFRGGCTAEAAQAVCEEPQALEFLTQLRERSLAMVEHDGAEPRFRLLESLREFAGEQLPEADRARRRARHGQYFLELAEESRAALRGPAQARWRARLTADEDNLRAALDAAHGDPDAVEAEMRLAGALPQFWAMRGHLREGRGRLEDALARGGEAPAAARAAALHGACFLAYWQGDYPATQSYSEAALELWPAVDDKLGPLKSRQMLANALLYQGRYEDAKLRFAEALAQARALEGEGPNSATSLGGLAIIANWQGDYAQARAHNVELVHLLEKTGDLHNLALILYNQGEIERGLNDLGAAQACFERGLALCRTHGSGPLGLLQISLALVALDREDWDAARALFEEGLALSRETGEEGDTAVALRGLGMLSLRLGQPAGARPLLAESLRLHEKQCDTRQLMVTLEEFAVLALAEGHAEQAARLLGASQSLADALGTVPTPAGAAEADRCAAQIRAALGEASYAALREEGRRWTCEEAVAAALRHGG